MSLEEKSENTQNSIDKDVFDTNNILYSNHNEKDENLSTKNSRRSSISFGFLNGKNHNNSDGSNKRRKSISVILLGRKTNKV